MWSSCKSCGPGLLAGLVARHTFIAAAPRRLYIGSLDKSGNSPLRCSMMRRFTDVYPAASHSWLPAHRPSQTQVDRKPNVKLADIIWTLIAIRKLPGDSTVYTYIHHGKLQRQSDSCNTQCCYEKRIRRLVRHCVCAMGQDPSKRPNMTQVQSRASHSSRSRRRSKAITTHHPALPHSPQAAPTPCTCRSHSR